MHATFSKFQLKAWLRLEKLQGRRPSSNSAENSFNAAVLSFNSSSNSLFEATKLSGGDSPFLGYTLRYSIGRNSGSFSEPNSSRLFDIITGLWSKSSSSYLLFIEDPNASEERFFILKIGSVLGSLGRLKGSSNSGPLAVTS